MEKAPITSAQPVAQVAAVAASEKDLEAQHIKRKPVPLPPSYTFVEREGVLASTGRQNQYSTRLPPPPAGRQTFFADLKYKWRHLSRRRRIILITTVVFLLLLIIILPAALVPALKHRTSNLPLPTANGGPYSGDLTYYDPGLGACGETSDSSDYIVSVSHYIFDAVSVGSNPNANPLCNKKIRAKIGDKSADLTVVDRCVGCQPDDLDVTRTVFTDLTGDLDLGRVTVSWSWLNAVPIPAQGG